MHHTGGTATPIDPDPAGVPTQTVTGAPDPAVTVVTVRPGRAYQITGDGGPGGYELTSSACRADDGASGPRDLVLTVNSVQRGTCTMVNTVVPPSPATVTLVRVTCTSTSTHRKPGPKPTPDPS
ncbi:hypothetical protein ACIP4V_15200 [Streptomyces albidoflavus]